MTALNAKVIGGFTALIFACTNGRKDIVQLLLGSKRNIDLNEFEFTAHGRGTALTIAFHNGRTDIVKLLVQHSKTKGIDISTGQEDLSDEMRLFIDSLQ